MNQPPPDSYALDPSWTDLVPLPQDDGEHPLAQIAYTEEYSEAMSYLRAIMAKNEYTPRVLQVTAHIIEMNPAHYTVWLYRAKTLLSLLQSDDGAAADLGRELRFLNDLALRHQKNYQIWNHRQTVVEAMAAAPELVGQMVREEKQFTNAMFRRDGKNYHVWSYRQWLVRRFAAWAGEVEFVDGLLAADVRNNSAWNHRYFVIFGQQGEEGVGDEVVEREVRVVEDAVFIAPQNASAWNYLRGLLGKVGRPLSSVEGLCLTYAPLDNPDAITSSHALDLLADIYAGRKEERAKAIKALELLAARYDPIRANYWNYRAGIIKAAA
ncbi:protein prenylyltransferase [Choiromyces venosus 120613-1]|uniref:Protein farnesyltransferase/geranylgeranyltransferase type-1 subunit alpha n=1 Tax=Choiromyces venosus 120613-1 TaxID=1336337 RepID=A0A3N4J1V4_9PEZI|nr:protein prenylyltransferase [Choiromyces venosus 120613-1]